jgi:chemotaxis protein methyltransferase CheR
VKRLAKNPHLKTLEQALANGFGWQPGTVRDALVDTVESKADRLGLDVVSYCRMAAAAHGELQALAEEVAVGETRFFREPDQFDAIRESVFPNLLGARATTRRLRLWSVGCSSGEEAYSLAMLVRDALQPDEEWRVELFASDLRGHAILQASRGRYTASGLRRLDPNLRNRYFIGIDEPGPNREYDLIPLVRRMVTFRRANVVEPYVWRQIPGPYDLIVCENLLVYFHRLAVEQTVERLVAALAPGGILVVSPAETSLVARGGLKPVEFLPRGFFARPSDAR